jgi:hypothetical protein
MKVCVRTPCSGSDGFGLTELWRIGCGGALIVSLAGEQEPGGLCRGISGLLMISMHL